MTMKYLFFIILCWLLIIIILSSCTRYQWVATETRISTVGQKIHIEQIGKPVPIGDTTIRGMLITKKRLN